MKSRFDLTNPVGIMADSNSPIPKIKYEIKLPELKGNIGDFNYIRPNVSISIEVTPMEDKGRQQTNPSTPLATESTINFSNEEIAAGLVVAAPLLIVGTIVEDFLTAGIGVADDPVSFATAATMHARAATLWRGATIIAPRALLPVTTRLTITVVPAGKVVYAH